MTVTGHDSLKTRRTLDVGGAKYDYFSLVEAGRQLGDVSRLPYSMKVLLENLLRFEDSRTVTQDDVKAAVDWLKERRSDREIAYRPARVLMQDLTGVPAAPSSAAPRRCCCCSTAASPASAASSAACCRRSAATRCGGSSFSPASSAAPSPGRRSRRRRR